MPEIGAKGRGGGTREIGQPRAPGSKVRVRGSFLARGCELPHEANLAAWVLRLLVVRPLDHARGRRRDRLSGRLSIVESALPTDSCRQDDRCSSHFRVLTGLARKLGTGRPAVGQLGLGTQLRNFFTLGEFDRGRLPTERGAMKTVIRMI